MFQTNDDDAKIILKFCNSNKGEKISILKRFPQLYFLHKNDMHFTIPLKAFGFLMSSTAQVAHVCIGHTRPLAS